MTTITELQARAYQQSADKGFHDSDPTRPPYGADFRVNDEIDRLYAKRVREWQSASIALMHSELSEALEELRKGFPADVTYYPTAVGDSDETDSPHNADGSPAKPEGVPSELADVVIRVLDFCGANDIDLESMITEKLDYNATRAHKHGKKF